MKAVVRRGPQLVLDTLEDPRPGPGQVLVKTIACGICGSDLHALHHLEQLIDSLKRVRFPDMPPPPLDHKCDMVFGHEFSAEIIEHGPECAKTLKAGAQVCSVPFLMGGPNGYELVGHSNRYPGGYGEYMILTESTLLPVPNGLPAEHAALTEPFSVGAHAVTRARPTKDDLFLVVGCGPVGLAVIASLKAQGFGPVLAADFSPRRRAFAAAFGADEVIDPAEVSPYSKWTELGVPRNAVEFKLLQAQGVTAKRPVIFECVGVPGLLQSVMQGAPIYSRIVAVGVCMEEDRIHPFVPINKEIDLHFSFGYSPEEYAATLRHISEGRINAGQIVTGQVGLDGVAQAFEDLADPETHAKILVRPHGVN